MAVVKVFSRAHARNLLKYMIDNPAHDNDNGVKTRSLGVKTLNMDDSVGTGVDYALQFAAVRETATAHGRSDKTNKRIQAHHVIVSFDKNELGQSDDDVTAALTLSADIAQQLAPGCQAVISVQGDGKSGLTHSHIALNSVQLDGKSLQTNNVTRSHVINVVNNTLETEYQRVTGKPYTMPDALRDKPGPIVTAFEKQKRERGEYVWKDDLRARIDRVLATATGSGDYRRGLRDNGVSVKHTKSTTTYLFDDANGTARRARAVRKRAGKSTGLGDNYDWAQVSQQLTANKEAQAAQQAFSAHMAALDALDDDQEQLDLDRVKAAQEQLQAAINSAAEKEQQENGSQKEREFIEPKSNQTNAYNQPGTNTEEVRSTSDREEARRREQAARQRRHQRQREHDRDTGPDF